MCSHLGRDSMFHAARGNLKLEIRWASRRVQIIRVPEEAEGQQSIYRARLSLTFVSSDQLVLATLEYRIHFEIALKGGRAILSYDQHHKRPSYQAPTVSRIPAL